jgi:hypothetical protein
MKSRISFENKEDYLYANISGDYNQIEFAYYPKLIRDKCEKENVYKVLLSILDLKGTDISVRTRFFLGVDIANALRYKIRIAAVATEKDITKFAATVARNRGADICVFGDIETAKKWLLNK